MDVVTKVEGTPAGGYRFVRDIVASNSRQFDPRDSAMDVAIEMVSSHTGGAPVVGKDYEFLGFINEGDIILAARSLSTAPVAPRVEPRTYRLAHLTILHLVDLAWHFRAIVTKPHEQWRL